MKIIFLIKNHFLLTLFLFINNDMIVFHEKYDKKSNRFQERPL